MRLFPRNRFVGIVDTQSSRILGWVFDRRTSDPVAVECYVDGAIVGTTIADLHRADLESEYPGGRCAFEFSLPAEVRDGRVRTVEMRARGATRPLTNGRFTIQLLPHDHYDELTRRILRSGLWALNGIIRNGAVEIGGWYIPPAGSAEERITVNGRTVELLISPGNGDIAWKTPCPAEFAVRKFAGRVTLDEGWNDLNFSFGRERPFQALQDFHYPLFDVEVPEATRRLRVHGNDSEFAFNLEGYSTAVKLDIIAKRFAGKPLSGLGPVLDWGCGCGRVGRFVARTGADLYGADIDADNIRWCADHINGGTFVGISREPPTSFENGRFGAIYGISVFTHLNQHYEALWLAELHRIAQPGALLLLSVLGGTAAALSGLLEYVFAPESAEGFVDVGRNPDIDLVTKGSRYYRNVFHRPEYIARVWGKYFEILAIEEGIIGNYQDLVVARKAAG